MVKSKKKALFILSAVILAVGCGGIAGLIEQAKFLLDRCNPTLESTRDDCTAAVEKANEIQATEPDNIEAASVEASGQMGLARLDFLTFAANLADLQDSGTDDFDRFRTFVSDYETDLNTDQGLTGLEIDLTELQAAKDVFGTLLDDVEVDEDGVAVDDLVKRTAFQAGMIQGLDAFIRPVKLASGGVANVAANITDAVTTAVLNDFLDADNNLVLGGTTTAEGDDLLRPIRENFCRCSLQTATGGFETDCLQDLMRCELYDGDGIEQDYDGNLLVNAADCDALLAPADLETCGGSNTDT